MNRFVFTVAFVIGLMVVGWVGWGFVGISALALVMTAMIGGVYLLGAFEIRQFREATTLLSAALDALAQPPVELGTWLERVPPSLRPSVRLRIESERAQLPGLALTPYLVGLLVMLGMLGTFLGMVVTFKGAVFALEGSTDLQAVRSALAAPIQGLGLSFGTSVAGVAASAMLGLLSALSRRERLEVARRLDTRIATVLRPFSRAHQREQTYKSLQDQAHVLPDVVDRLQAMMDGLERRSQQLNAQLLGQQANFHRDVTVVYTDLAQTVGTSLKESLTVGARAAGESITPVVEAAMSGIAEESTRMHQRIFDATQAQLSNLASELSAAARTVGNDWSTALQGHVRSSESHVDKLGSALTGFAETFDQRSTALLVTVNETAAMSHLKQTTADQQRMQAWMQALEAMAANSRTAGDGWVTALQHHARNSENQVDKLGLALVCFAETFEQRSASLLLTVHEAAASSQATQATADQQRLQAWTHVLEAIAATLHGEWQRVGTQTLADQRAASLALTLTANEATEQASQQAGKTLGEIAILLAQSEALIRSRADSETRWVQQQGERMDQLANLWRAELGALRAEEAARGHAAVARLGELQSALASHLASLGASLEAPMSRLMQTASEVPQAAAGVITQLRQEMTRLTERDNLAFDERSGLLEKIGELLQSLNEASCAQQESIESLVAAAATVLDQAGSQFSQTLHAQAGQAADVAAHVSSSAVELASLGESFGHGVQLFSTTNEKLMDSLQRMEGAIGKSIARSDEQLAYYVAQAREVIDLSITSQQRLVEDLKRRDIKPSLPIEASVG